MRISSYKQIRISTHVNIPTNIKIECDLSLTTTVPNTESSLILKLPQNFLSWKEDSFMWSNDKPEEYT